jgi:GMP synthase-like glutamine amidotransferase
MKILIIDNNLNRDSWGASSLLKYTKLTSELPFEVRRAPDRDLPKNLDDYSKIIISGSKTSILEEAPWIEELENFLSRALQKEIPTLGICYGHQILGKILFGKPAVGRAAQPEFGWIKVVREFTGSALLEGVPQEFYTFSSHNDEVFKLDPTVAQTLCHSELCGIQGFEHKRKPVFGIQFHPEKDLDGAQKIYTYLKNDKRAHWFKRLKDGPKLYNQAIGDRIFTNFLKMKS